MRTLKSWREKIEEQSSKLPRTVDIPKRMEKRFGRGRMLIPSPSHIEEIIRNVKKGETITQEEIREMLAKRFKVRVTCPITTGIFLRMIAEAGEEERSSGKKPTPWWRVLKGDRSLNEKYPGFPETQRHLLENEGHRIFGKGKRYVVD